MPSRKRSSGFPVKLGCALVILVFLISALLFRSGSHSLSKVGKETMGQVISRTKTITGKTCIEYRYFANSGWLTNSESGYFLDPSDFVEARRKWKRKRGKDRTSWETRLWEENYWRSRRVSVVYDPDRPNRSALGTRDKTWAPQGWMGRIVEILMTLVLLTGGLVWMISGISKKKKNSTTKPSRRRRRN